MKLRGSAQWPRHLTQAGDGCTDRLTYSIHTHAHTLRLRHTHTRHCIHTHTTHSDTATSHCFSLFICKCVCIHLWVYVPLLTLCMIWIIIWSLVLCPKLSYTHKHRHMYEQAMVSPAAAAEFMCALQQRRNWTYLSSSFQQFNEATLWHTAKIQYFNS